MLIQQNDLLGEARGPAKIGGQVDKCAGDRSIEDNASALVGRSQREQDGRGNEARTL